VGEKETEERKGKPPTETESPMEDDWI